jgi:hypothetical protein
MVKKRLGENRRERYRIERETPLQMNNKTEGINEK